MKSLFKFLSLIPIISVIAFAQQRQGNFPGGSISGRVIDSSTKHTIEYANIIVFSLRDSLMVTGGVTNSDIVGDVIFVEADILADGHDELSCVLLYQREGDFTWAEVPMEENGNDRWRAFFKVSELGHYLYTLLGWIDHFKTWRRDLLRRVEAGQDISVDMLIGAELVRQAQEKAVGENASRLSWFAESMQSGEAGGTGEALFGRVSRPHASVWGQTLCSQLF